MSSPEVQEAPDFSQPNPGLSEMIVAANRGDLGGMAEGMRKATEVDRGGVVPFMLAAALVIIAISNLIKSTGTAGAPIIVAIADKMKEEDRRKDGRD